MSLLRRKRRQNRLSYTESPATREMRFSLEPIGSVRGLRTEYNEERRLRLSRERERKSLRTIELPYNPATLDFNREVKQAKAIHEYNKVRLAQSKHAVKPLYTIRLDKSIKVDLPPEHPICVQREERRMMMFATGKAGKGGQRPRRQDNNIKIRCGK